MAAAFVASLEVCTGLSLRKCQADGADRYLLHQRYNQYARMLRFLAVGQPACRVQEATWNIRPGNAKTSNPKLHVLCPCTYFTPSKQSTTFSAMEYDGHQESCVHKILPEHEAIDVEFDSSYCRFFFRIQLSLIIDEALNTAFPMVNLGDMSALRPVVRFPAIAYPLIKYHPYGSCDPDSVL